MTATEMAPRSGTVIDRPVDSADTIRPRPHTGWLAMLPALAALAIGLIGAAEREMWNNEYATWHAATLSVRDLRHLLSNTDLVHTLYILIMRVWIDFFGDTPLMMRLPSVLAMSAAAGLTALLGRRLINAPTGLVGGLLFALIPSVSRYAQEARSYATVTMAVTLTTLLLLRALEKPVTSRWVLYGLSIALVGWLHFVSLTILAAHLIFVARTASADDARRYRWAGSVGVAGLSLIPLLSFASRQSASISWIKGDLDAVATFPQQMFLSWEAAGLILGLGAIGVAVLWRATFTPLALLATWALLPPVFVYITFPILHLFLARYILFTLPAWSLLAAAAICGAGTLLSRKPRAWIWAVSATLILPAFVYLVEPDQRVVRASPASGQPDYRGAIDAIHHRQQPGDGIAYNDVFGQLSDLAREATDYEMRNDTKPVDVFLEVSSIAKGSYSASECSDAASCSVDSARIWLISTTSAADPLEGMHPARAALLRNYKIVSDQKYEAVRLLLLSRTG